MSAGISVELSKLPDRWVRGLAEAGIFGDTPAEVVDMIVTLWLMDHPGYQVGGWGVEL